MAKMAKIHLWYGMNGEILAVGQPMGSAQCMPIAGENQSVMETEIDEAHIATFHQTHRVDPLKKLAVKF